MVATMKHRGVQGMWGERRVSGTYIVTKAWVERLRLPPFEGSAICGDELADAVCPKSTEKFLAFDAKKKTCLCRSRTRSFLPVICPGLNEVDHWYPVTTDSSHAHIILSGPFKGCYRTSVVSVYLGTGVVRIRTQYVYKSVVFVFQGSL